jgi:hypothetical protein
MILAARITIPIAALLLATGTAHAQKYRGPTTEDDPLYKVMRPYDPVKDYRPNYDTRPWSAAPSSPLPDPSEMCEKDEECAAECMKKAKTRREKAICRAIVITSEIPKQYHGEWCQTKWKTIYKRCRSGTAFSVLRDSWGVDDENCTLVEIRKSRYGHKLLGRCSRADPTPEDKAYIIEERWQLSSDNTRLQVFELLKEVERN